MLKVFIVNFKQISHVVLMFPLLTSNKQMLPWLLCTEFEQVGSITVETAEQYMLFRINSFRATF